jgi:hypothetical protein
MRKCFSTLFVLHIKMMIRESESTLLVQAFFKILKGKNFDSLKVPRKESCFMELIKLCAFHLSLTFFLAYIKDLFFLRYKIYHSE